MPFITELLDQLLKWENPLQSGVEFKTLFWVVSAYLEVLTDPPLYPRPLDELAIKIRQQSQQSQGIVGLLYACVVGELLVEAHAQISPQEWPIWLQKNCNLSEYNALTYMQMARGWSKFRVSPKSSEVPAFPDPTHAYTPLTDPFATAPTPSPKQTKKAISDASTPTPVSAKITSPFDLLLKSQSLPRQTISPSPVVSESEQLPTVSTAEITLENAPEITPEIPPETQIRESIIDRAPPVSPAPSEFVSEEHPTPTDSQEIISDEIISPDLTLSEIAPETTPEIFSDSSVTETCPDPVPNIRETQSESTTVFDSPVNETETSETPAISSLINEESVTETETPETPAPPPEQVTVEPPVTLSEPPAEVFPEVFATKPLADQSEREDAYAVIAERMPTEEVFTSPEQSSPVLTFSLAGNVVPKARPRVTANGTFLPPQYKAWRNYAEVEIYRQLCDRKLPFKLPLRKASVFMRFFGNHRTNADLDNLAGSCLDALTLKGAGVLLDDRISCVPKLTVEYVPDSEETGVWIQIKPL